MKRITLLVTALGALALTACGPGQAVVTAEIQSQGPEGNSTVTRALSDLEVQLLPYNRDQVFDSLEQAHPEPEPPIPDSLLAAREEVAQAQREWRQAEARWNRLRDTLQAISQTMEQYNRGESRYVELFRQFQDMEGQLSNAEEEMNQAFERFDSLQQGIIEQSEQIRTRRQDWADDAFADAVQVIEAKIEEAGREPVIDTTDANGTVTFEAPPGQWWVHTRYELPYTELYWNEPITIERGEPTEITLSRENAEERPNL